MCGLSRKMKETRFIAALMQNASKGGCLVLRMLLLLLLQVMVSHDWLTVVLVATMRITLWFNDSEQNASEAKKMTLPRQRQSNKLLLLLAAGGWGSRSFRSFLSKDDYVSSIKLPTKPSESNDNNVDNWLWWFTLENNQDYVVRRQLRRRRCSEIKASKICLPASDFVFAFLFFIIIAPFSCFVIESNVSAAVAAASAEKGALSSAPGIISLSF